MTDRVERKAFVVSPHQDDAVLSLGSLLHTQYDRVSVLNIFTQSSSHMLENVSDDPSVVSQIRHAEDESITAEYGFQFIDAGFRDSELRSVAWNDALSPVDEELLEAVASSIDGYIARGGQEMSDVYIPAAFGLHPDHYLTLLASLRALGGRELTVYGDQPYFLETHAVRHGAHDMLRRDNGERIPFSAEIKERMLSLYPSQLTAARIKRLGAATYEFIWRLSSENTRAMSERVAKRSATVVGSFGDVRWINAIKETYESDTRVSIMISAENNEGASVDMPMMLDRQDVPGVGPVVFGRCVSVYGSDYLDFNDMRRSDANSLRQLRLALKREGARYMWVSNMRDGDGYVNLLELLPEGRAETFEGIPSLITTCSGEGFDAWLSSLTAEQKKKYRQVERKRKVLEDAYGAVSFTIEDGTQKNLEAFLSLQAKRAGVANLDAFAEDPVYASFLARVAQQGLISFASVYVSDEKVSTLAILDDATNRSIAILGQGFENRWAYYSPSYINMYNLIRYAHEVGYNTVDFLRGDERYKAYFTDYKQHLYKHIEALEDVPDDEWEKVVAFVKEYEE